MALAVGCDSLMLVFALKFDSSMLAALCCGCLCLLC